MTKRRLTPIVHIGSVAIGGKNPVVVQSMTDTPTADIDKTFAQTMELIKAGSELVRWTVNDDDAARAVPILVRRLADNGLTTPIIGDFHFNGHILLSKYPDMARSLAKYRINPGNIGHGRQHDQNFETFIQLAVKYRKAVRIGVNGGSLDEEIFTSQMSANARRKKPKDFQEITYDAMVNSALQSARYALKLGLRKNQIVLSVKMSSVPDMVEVYQRLAKKCDFALHLGLTEAGSDISGTVASAAALAILLRQGIGDTIRVSLTPQPGVPRAREVEVCKNLLQSLGLRHFYPTVISCPGCGRTNRDLFQNLNEGIRKHVQESTSSWREKFPGSESLKIAVMGCVVNGPGESRHADIGISLPGATERGQALVYADHKKIASLQGNDVLQQFLEILENYIRQRFKKI